jgi:hypothetical protein
MGWPPGGWEYTVADPCSQWRGLKQHIKRHTIQYCYGYRRQQRAARQQLQRQVRTCEAAALAVAVDEGRAVAARQAVQALQQHDEGLVQQE